MKSWSIAGLRHAMPWRMQAADKWVLPRPTMVTLRDIEMHRSLEALLEDASRRDIRVFPKDSTYYRPQEMGC